MNLESDYIHDKKQEAFKDIFTEYIANIDYNDLDDVTDYLYDQVENYDGFGNTLFSWFEVYDEVVILRDEHKMVTVNIKEGNKINESLRVDMGTQLATIIKDLHSQNKRYEVINE